jgi:hypothetical protein
VPKILLALTSLLVVALAGTIQAAEGRSSSASTSSCVSAVTASAGASDHWTCIQSYTSNGVTHSYGDPDFFSSLPPETPVSVVNGVATSAAAADATRATQDVSGQHAAASVSGRTLSAARRAETRTFQSDTNVVDPYGVGSTQVGELHLYTHININGRQIQNTPSLIKNSGPSVDPSVGAAAAGCGENDFGPEGGYHNTWYPPMESFYCNLDGSFFNEYAWVWSAQGYSGYWEAEFYSNTWSCSALFQAPCAFGS